MKLKDLLEKRAKLIADARALHAKAEGESRPLSTEETEQHKKLLTDIKDQSRSIQALNDLATIEREHSLDEREAGIEAERAEVAASLQGRKTQPGDETPTNPQPQANSGQRPKWLAEVLDEFGIKGASRQRTISRVAAAVATLDTKAATDQYRDNFRAALTTRVMSPELMALNQETDAGGHFLMPPPRMLGEFLAEADANIFMRQICRMIPMKSLQEITVPYRKKRLGAPKPVSPLGYGADGQLEVGERKLKPTMTKLNTRIETMMLTQSVIPAEQLVREQLGLEFAEASEQEYMTGPGNNGPLGIFVPSPRGISTARDFDKHNTVDDITFEGLRHTRNRVPEKYRQKATWVGHTDILEMIANKKNMNGDFVWRESVIEGEPDKLLGRPVRLCDFAPNAVAPGAYALAFGDFQFYWIVEFGGLQIQVLHELYSGTNETGFVGRLWRDAAPVMEEAFSRCKFADAP